MFGLSFGEIVIIAVLALVLLGPERLPDAAKTLGKAMRDLKRATDDLKDQIETEIYADEQKPKPALVPPVPTAPVPGPSGPPPVATADNVPGLEAALVEPGSTDDAAPATPAVAERGTAAAEDAPAPAAQADAEPAAPGASAPAASDVSTGRSA